MHAIEFALLFFPVNLLPGLALAFYVARRTEGIGLIDKLIIAVVLAPLALILVSFVEDVSGIPQSSPVLFVNTLGLALANIALLARYFRRRQDWALRLGWVKVVAYGMFAALIFFRVAPAFGLLTPIVHDPVSHVEWLKHLNLTHFSTNAQWYPQGLEYYLNYYATFFGSSYARTVLISQNYLIALFPVSMFYLGLLIFRGKDKWFLFPLVMFAIGARLPKPDEYFFAGGQNSMVFAFSVTPLLLYLATSVKNRWDYVIAAAFIFAAIVIHYPFGFFMLFTLFAVNLGRLVRRRGKKPFVDKKTLMDYGAAAVVIGVLGALLLKKILPIYSGYSLGQDRSFDPFILMVHQAGIFYYVYTNFLSDMIAQMRFTWILLFAGTVPALLLLADNQKKFAVQLLAVFAVLYVLGVMLLKLNQRLGVNYNVQVRFFLIVVMAVVVPWLIYYVINRMVLRLGHQPLLSAALVVIVGLFFLQGGWSQYGQYKSNGASLETVKQPDLQAFSFIKANVKDDRHFLIQLDKGPGSFIVSGADSGVWIPAFTGKKVEVDFRDFASDRSQDIFKNYKALARNGSDQQAIRSLYCNYDIGYVFFGSREIYSDNMKPRELLNSPHFQEIFSNGATIFKFKPVSCSA